MDVAFRFASRFEQCLYCGALVMSSASSRHRFFWCCPSGSSENFGALIRVLKSARASGVFKADSQNSDVCAEVIMRTLNGLLLAGFM